MLKCADSQRTNDITSGRSSIVYTHKEGLLCLTTSVGNDPRYDDRIGAEKEGKEIISGKSRTLLQNSCSVLDIQESETNDNRDDKDGEDS